MSLIERRELCFLQLSILAQLVVAYLKEGNDNAAQRLLAERAMIKGELRALNIAIQVNSN